jgi:hypothetical protein
MAQHREKVSPWTKTAPLVAHLDALTNGAASAGDRASNAKPCANESDAIYFKLPALSARDICNIFG